MKSFTKISIAFLNGILLSVFIIFSTNSVLAQSVFNRNDNYDFRGLHHLSAGGSNPDNFNIFIESESDFRKFKLHIVKNRLTLPGWYANLYRVDMNNDGGWEQGWTTASELTISYNYPNPPNGISTHHTIKVEIQYSDGIGQTTNRIKYDQITIFSTARVYVDADNNSFIQLRDEDATGKIPVLMIEGFDPLNEKFPDTYYDLTWELINTDLYPNNYEVFILNFLNGGRDLRLNADVLMKAIEKVHEVCPNYKIALAGLSMGGTIGRFALAKKEDEGGTHNVGLFLSYDSPQYWAHVNPFLQDWIKQQNPNEGAIGELQANLQSVGAKQMLGYNTYDPSHIFRDEFYNELNALNEDGYPHQSYNVSVSNGNFEATWGNESTGRHLLTLKINDVLFTEVPAVEFDCETGSKITDITMKRYGDIFSNPFINISYELEIIFNPAYQPTWSALDLVNWDDDSFGNIISYDYSKFDDFVVQVDPLEHHELSPLTQNTIMDWLDEDFNITVNYNLPEGGSVSPDNYQVQILHGVQINVLPKTITVNGRQITYFFQNWEDGSTENSRTFYTSHDVTHTATMKAANVSNNQNAYGTGSQRRFVRLYDGTLFSLYQSIGKVWIERSVDNGQSWTLWPNSLPFDNSSDELECTPSIDWIPWTATHSFAAVANITPIFELKVRVIRHNSINPYYTGTLYPSWGNNASAPLTPALAVSSSHIFVVGNGGMNDNEEEGLYYFYGTISFNGSAVSINWIDAQNPKIIPGSTQYSKNPTIMADKDGSTFHIAWEDGNHIKYRNVTVNGNDLTYSALVTPSSNCGYSQYYSPSILVMETDNLARLCWVGRRYVCPKNLPTDCTGEYQYKVLFKGLNNLSTHWQFGTNGNIVSSPNINKKNNNISNPYYAFGWYESSGENKFADNTLSTVRTLNTVGQRVQICNGADKNNMYAMSFNYGSGLPYYFQRSDDLGSFYSMEKIQYNAFTSGREGVVSVDSADFYFSVGDIQIDEQPVDFVEIADTVPVNNLAALNEYLITEPINVSDNCSFVYSVQYGINDSLSAAEVMIEDRFINFKVQLIDANSGEIIGEHDNITFNAENLYDYGNICYQVNMQGIGNRTVRLKLVVNDNFASEYSLGKIYSDESVLGKANVQQINYNAEDVITSYDLSQNYPNPFNPTTTIKYQLPSSGNVSLKIYDILGSEVATLVNEFQNEGRYEVNFSAGSFGNAGSLASGVYIYRLNVNDPSTGSGQSFVSVKKMVVLK